MMNEKDAIAWEERDGAKQATIRGMSVRLEDVRAAIDMKTMSVPEPDMTGGMALYIEDSIVPVAQMSDGTYYAEAYQYTTFEELDELVQLLVNKKIEHAEGAQ